jgi:uncharacterized membrane protein YcaP (DUF421 family)
MHVSWFELSVYAGKTVVVLFVLVVLYRLIGKRELAQMNAYDLVTIMAVANAVQNAMTQGRGELVIGLVTSGTLILAAYAMSRLFIHAPIGERILLGEPVLILSNGEPLVDRMKRERVSSEDLNAALRQHGMHTPEQAAMAVLEIDGSISVVPRGQARHVDTDLL